MPEKIKNNTISMDTPVPVKSARQRFLALGLIVLLLLVGAGVSRYLLTSRPKAVRKPPAKMVALVNTMDVIPISTHVTVKAMGRIIAAREITIQARVSGQIVYLHSNFFPGGIIKEGEILARLDDTDYQLILKQKQSGLAQKEADLRIEQGSQSVARQEWELINRLSEDIDQSTKDLALRKPQLAKAHANVQAAAAELEKAEVDLQRTVIKAPFNGILRKKQSDLGTEVSSQSSMGILTCTDTFWAEISLPVEKLQWLDLPDARSRGSKVTIYSGSSAHGGNILNLQPELEKDGLMARILIEIHDPMGLATSKTPLLLASFVQVDIKGKRMENVYEIPRSALGENDQLLIADNNKLHIQPVSVLWKSRESVFVELGLEPGDKVIVSNVPAAIEGMALKISEDQAGTIEKE